MRRLIERQRRALASHDAGFTLVELIVAMMIIATVLLLLMVVQTSALVTTSQARQRQQATAVANQTLEELRALPWTVLSNGLNTTYVGSNDDPNIPIGTTTLHPSANLSINESLKTSSAQVGPGHAPLASGTNNTNKIVQTDPSIPGMTFEARSYTSVSNSPNTPSNVIMLTVIVTWKRVGDAKVRTVIARSAAFAPTWGCGSLTNQPFLGACEAIVSSAGGTQGPSISVSGASVGPPIAGSVPILPGTTALTATLLSGQADGSSSSQQSVTVDSGATTAGGFVNDASDTPLASVGLLQVLNKASNDAGTTGAAPPNPSPATGTGTAAPFSVSSGVFVLRMAPSSSGLTGTAQASLLSSCRLGVPPGQGCARGFFTSGAAAKGTFEIGTTTPATVFTLASNPGLTSTNEGWAARFATAAGTDPSVGCATPVSGAGCASGGAARTLPQIDVGAGPWITAGTGIVQITGYSDTLMVQRGTSQLGALPAVTRNGQIKYWNGSGYSAPLTLNVLTSQTLTAIPVLTWTGGGYTVTAATTVSITRPATTTTGTDPLCKADSCSINADTGSVTISVTYTVSGAASFAFVAVTSLGTTRASAAFKAAPSA